VIYISYGQYSRGNEHAPKTLPDLTRVEMAILATLVLQERYGLDIVRTLRTKGQPISLAWSSTRSSSAWSSGGRQPLVGDEKAAVPSGSRALLITASVETC